MQLCVDQRSNFVMVSQGTVYGQVARKSSRPKSELRRELRLSSKIKERDISLIYRACFIVHQGLKSEIYYTFIPLVSSHRCLKNEVCCTFVLLVSSHDGLKNKIAETLYSTKINFLCALRLIKFERHDPAFRATWPVTLEHNRVISRYSLKWTDLENANADRLFKVLTNV